MDVGNLADREEAVEVKRLASLAPQTVAAFVGSEREERENTGSFCVARWFPSGKEGVGRVVFMRWPTGVQWPFIRLICNVI